MENSGNITSKFKNQTDGQNSSDVNWKRFDQADIDQASILFDVQHFFDAYNSLPQNSK